MLLSVPSRRRKTPSPSSASFGKPSRTSRTPTPSSLTYSYSDTFENSSQQSVDYSDTFESLSKQEPTTIKTARFSTIVTELDGDIQTIKELTRLSDSYPTYSDTFESYSDKGVEKTDNDDDSFQTSRSETESIYSGEESQSYGTRTLESVAESSTDRYSSDEFEDAEPYSYSESYEYSESFEPTEDTSSVIPDPETLRKEEELFKITEEAKENYISAMVNSLRNRRFKDTDITELSQIEPLETKKIIDHDSDNFSKRYFKRKMALLKHKKKHGYKPVEERPWPGQKTQHVTEYGLDPQIVEKLKIKNLITKMGNAAKSDIHDPKKCRECRVYEREIDEEAAKRHYIRLKKSQIQKHITENHYIKHMTRMDPINLIGELAKSLPRPTADPAEITDKLNQGLTLSKHL